MRATLDATGRALLAAAMMAAVFWLASFPPQAKAQDQAQVTNPCGVVRTTGGSLPLGNVQPIAQSQQGNLCIDESGVAITPVWTGAAASSLVLKSSSGVIFTASAVNFTGTPGFLLLLNSSSAPADGAVTPVMCAPLPANGSVSINYGSGGTLAANYSVGIVAVVSSGANCFTKTTTTITGFISGQVR